MPKPGFLVKSESGLTLVEVLVSVTLLVLMSLTFGPALLFVMESSEKNRIRMVGTALANEVIEEYRAKPFDEIIIEEGVPVGEKVEKKIVDGREYRIRTFINWQELDESGAASWDYKGIKVEVSPIGAYEGKGTTVTMETAVSREFGLPFLAGANIRVHAYRGWQESDEKQPIGDLKINVVSGHKGISVRTDARGAALFLGLDPGVYTVAPEPSSVRPAMLLLPGTFSSEIEIEKGVTEEVDFFLEIPCRLTIRFIDSENNPLSLNGDVFLRLPFIDETGEPILLRKEISGPSVTFENIWPVGKGYAGSYSVVVKAGALSYDMSEDENRLWDGTFPEGPGSNLMVTVDPTVMVEEDENGEDEQDESGGA